MIYIIYLDLPTLLGINGAKISSVNNEEIININNKSMLILIK